MERLLAALIDRAVERYYITSYEAPAIKIDNVDGARFARPHPSS